jgi:replicative DNA helicase
MKEAYNVGFIVIDYLQLITGSSTGRMQENRQVEISEISRMLKNLARELNVPILCLAQLSRKVEERQGHRPMMSDLRESGCLSAETLIQDAETKQFHTIKELSERKDPKPLKVFALNQDLKLNIHTMTRVFYSGKKIVYLIEMRSGKKIKASANHPFYKDEGWTRLDQLNPGDLIATTNTAHEILWDEILSLSELGSEDVYDATVPDVHNFVANDFIVHNSLEQDSDVVMFLLRREYYDPYDKPGLAELIIAKNRHGAIGNVNLAFRKEIAQFANYTSIQGGAEIAKANKEAFSAFSPED